MSEKVQSEARLRYSKHMGGSPMPLDPTGWQPVPRQAGSLCYDASRFGGGGALNKMRCARHAEREAAACCAACGVAFCRECVSEHEGRLLCAACLEKIVVTAKAGEAARGRFLISPQTIKRALALVAGVAWLWLCFYVAGLAVEKLPRSLHEGTVWSRAAGEGVEKR